MILDFADDIFWEGFLLGVLAGLSFVGVLVLAVLDTPRYPGKRRRAYARRR